MSHPSKFRAFIIHEPIEKVFWHFFSVAVTKAKYKENKKTQQMPSVNVTSVLASLRFYDADDDEDDDAMLSSYTSHTHITNSSICFICPKICVIGSSNFVALFVLFIWQQTKLAI